MGRANNKSLKCEQQLGNNAMYWYKQNAGQPPELMFLYNLKQLILNETVPSRFFPECPDTSQLFLHLSALEPEDSAVYFCASSKDTALQIHQLSVHKPQFRKQWNNQGLHRTFSFCRAQDRVLQTITISSNSSYESPLYSMDIFRRGASLLCIGLLPTDEKISACGFQFSKEF